MKLLEGVAAMCAAGLLLGLSAVADNPIVTKQTPVAAAPVHELTFSEHEKIELVASFEIPEGYESTYHWEIDGAESTVYEGGKILAVWASPGVYKAEFEAWLINWDLRDQQHLKEKFNIVVQGARPPPDPDPSETTTTGPVTSIVVRNAEDLTSAQTTALLAVRDWADQHEVTHLEFDIDAVGPDGKSDARVKAFADAVPDSASLPYGFITKKKSTGSGSAVVWAGEFRDADSWITKIEDFR
jgi:hypothetical protein